jgi:hypothetical protein
MRYRGADGLCNRLRVRLAKQNSYLGLRPFGCCDESCADGGTPVSGLARDITRKLN